MKQEMTIRYRPLTDTLTAWIDDFASDDVRRVNIGSDISIELSRNKNRKNALCGLRVSECRDSEWIDTLVSFVSPNILTQIADTLSVLRSRGDTLASIRHNSQALWVTYLTVVEEEKIEIFA